MRSSMLDWKSPETVVLVVLLTGPKLQSASITQALPARLMS